MQTHTSRGFTIFMSSSNMSANKLTTEQPATSVKGTGGKECYQSTEVGRELLCWKPGRSHAETRLDVIEMKPFFFFFFLKRKRTLSPLLF